MVEAAMIVFGFSLLGIAAMFAVKYRELRAGRVLVPSLREAGDERALALKGFLASCRAEAATWPSRAVIGLQGFAQALALSIAALARIIERQAHRWADLASHKHRFERRETSSDFLKRVSDFKSDAETSQE